MFYCKFYFTYDRSFTHDIVMLKYTELGLLHPYNSGRSQGGQSGAIAPPKIP